MQSICKEEIAELPSFLQRLQERRSSNTEDDQGGNAGGGFRGTILGGARGWRMECLKGVVVVGVKVGVVRAKVVGS